MMEVTVEIPSHTLPENGFVKTRCPFHDDRHPSGSILFRDGKPVLIRCFAGCSPRRVVDYRVDGKRLRLLVVETEGRTSRLGKTKRPPKKAPAPGENRGGFSDPRAIQLIRQIVTEEAEAILRGLFVESPEAVRFWESFMEIKQVPKGWIGLAVRPICGVGLYYPIQIFDPAGEPVRETIYQIRTNTDSLKSLYHPKVELPGGAIRLYSPHRLDLGEIHKPIVIVEAPHHALRIAALGLDVLPIATCGLSNVERVYELLSGFGEVVAVFADDPPPAYQPIFEVRIADLDQIDNPTLVSTLTKRG